MLGFQDDIGVIVHRNLLDTLARLERAKIPYKFYNWMRMSGSDENNHELKRRRAGRSVELLPKLHVAISWMNSREIEVVCNDLSVAEFKLLENMKRDFIYNWEPDFDLLRWRFNLNENADLIELCLEAMKILTREAKRI